MKKHLVLLFTLAATLMMASCTKKEEANYYVKYEAAATGTNHHGTLTLNVNTEKGMQTITTSSKTFSETFGPVSKGFEASITVSANFPTYYSTSIYVSKGQEPFVLKATGELKAEYVIDF